MWAQGTDCFRRGCAGRRVRGETRSEAFASPRTAFVLCAERVCQDRSSDRGREVFSGAAPESVSNRRRPAWRVAARPALHRVRVTDDVAGLWIDRELTAGLMRDGAEMTQ